MDTVKPKKTNVKEIYCAVCNKWLTGYYTTRHINSQKRYKKTNIVSQCPISASNFETAVTPSKEDNQQEHEHYRIEGSTLKKCPHQHTSALDRCRHFDDQSCSSSEEEHDIHS